MSRSEDQPGAGGGPFVAKRVGVDWTFADPPAPVLSFLDEAHARIARFLEGRGERRIPGFITSDFHLAYEGLSWVAGECERRGADVSATTFCEWGSGFGVVTCLASMLGFRSVGIEIEPDLVEASRRLSADHGLDAEFFAASYQPPGTHTGTIDETRLDEGLGFVSADFDVVFVYPWRVEEPAAFLLFERYGRPGAWFLTYHGGADLRVWRRELADSPEPAVEGRERR